MSCTTMSVVVDRQRDLEGYWRDRQAQKGQETDIIWREGKAI